MKYLLEYVEKFYKQAGTLKVPDQLLEDVFQYIRACYCQRASDTLKKKIMIHNSRVKNQDKIFKLKERWEQLYEIFSDISYSGRFEPSEIKQGLDKLVAFSKNNDLSIPKINMRKKDFGNWLGVIEKGDLAFFRFEKSSKDTYRLDYIVNITKDAFPEAEEEMEDSKAKTTRIEVSKTKLTVKEAWELCHQLYNSNKILAPFDYLDYIRLNWDAIDANYFRHIQTVYGYCKRFAAGESSESKVFKLDPSTFPYKINFNKNEDYEFTAQFVTNDKRKAIYDKENWGGLWQDQRTIKEENGGNFIYSVGTLTVAGDPEQDAKLFDNVQHLKEKLDDLKRITRHELQHFMQTVLGRLTKVPGTLDPETWKGVPSKNIREKDYDIHGRKTNEKQAPEAGSRLDHSLRDVEFYTRLSDAIDKFNKTKNILPKSLHSLLAKRFIRSISEIDFNTELLNGLRAHKEKELSLTPQWNQYTPQYWESRIEREVNVHSYIFLQPYRIARDETFFEDLKNKQPGKYRKAVLEFIKATS